MVARRLRANLGRKSVRVRPPSAPDPPFFSGNVMRAKKTPPKSKRKTSKISQASTRASSMILMATRNLINMVAVGATSGAVLLTLLAVKHF
jgi:hypothetical protein